jgi:hypothetical protein
VPLLTPAESTTSLIINRIIAADRVTGTLVKERLDF